MPVLLREASLAAEFADEMLGEFQVHFVVAVQNIHLNLSPDEGIYVIGFSYPVVPHGMYQCPINCGFCCK